MNKMRLEIFDGEAECVHFESDGDEGILFEISELIDGLVSIDGVVKLVNSGRCVFDARLLPDGVHEPYLLAGKKRIPLPKIKKQARKIRLADFDSEYVMRISLRERRLAERVRALEGEIEKLSEKIYGSTVF